MKKAVREHKNGEIAWVRAASLVEHPGHPDQKVHGRRGAMSMSRMGRSLGAAERATPRIQGILKARQANKSLSGIHKEIAVVKAQRVLAKTQRKIDSYRNFVKVMGKSKSSANRSVAKQVIRRSKQ